LITGSSGWIGRNAIDLLHEALGPEEFQWRVHLFGSVARELKVGSTMVRQRPLADMARLDCRPTLVLHLAFLTKDKAAMMDERAYVAANEALRHQLIGNLDRIGAERVFVASSGAAAQADNPEAAPALRLYGALKQADEDSFAAWAEEGGKRAVICRIFSLTGQHINTPEAYALASFILQALAGQAVMVKAEWPVFRSYVPVREMVTLILSLLLERSDGVVRCETGGAPLEMGEIAGEVARQMNVGVTRPSFDPTAKPDYYVGEDEAYRALLATQGMSPATFPRQVAETVAFLAGLSSQEEGHDVMPFHPSRKSLFQG
jgi:nucleoside-diphosphate-sugar epimerase